MTPEPDRNKATVRRLVEEVVNRGLLEVIDVDVGTLRV
jgi:hypothetical protein